jgi:hypothetical protein
MESFIIPAIPFIFFIVVAVAMIFLNFHFAKIRREKMEKLAKELGLEFQSSGGEKSVQNQFGQTEQASSKSLGFIQLLFNIFSDWKIIGNYGSDYVEIYTETRGSGKSKTTYTIFFMKAQQTLPYKLEITNQGMIGGFFIKLFKMEDIIIGDERFDKTYVIKGDNPESIKKLFINPIVQKPIYELMDESGFKILHDGIYYESQGIISDALVYKKHLPKMSAVCSKIYSVGGDRDF